MDIGQHPRQNTHSARSFTGCWTCRLRRKKCDEKHPICGSCAALLITCHYSQDKPEWMDGGPKQEAMAEQLKREVREKANQRRGERAPYISGDDTSASEPTPEEWIVLSEGEPGDIPEVTSKFQIGTPATQKSNTGSSSDASGSDPQRQPICAVPTSIYGQNFPLERSDTALIMFYIEQVFPFLFPFYHPSPVQGGKAWILEMALKSPVVRQAILCQSKFYFSLADKSSNEGMVSDSVLQQTKNTWSMLRKAVQVISGPDFTEHIHGAARILASIMQVQRFEISVLCFDHCQTHLSAALALFDQLLSVVEPSNPLAAFNGLLEHLESPFSILPGQNIRVSNAEQAAFRFSTTLLIIDDIIASTTTHEQPRLYHYHRSLLGNLDDTNSPIDLEATVGLQNWAIVQIGEIAMLDAWKQERKRNGSLDIMELVHRATDIKNTTTLCLDRMQSQPVKTSASEAITLLDLFTQGHDDHTLVTSTRNTALVTTVWSHAALIYLHIVVSGWQPANADLRFHVSRIMHLLTHETSPPALLRTMVWPFCVAGCLADPCEEHAFREMVQMLHPPGVFGTMGMALQIMEKVWSSRNTIDTANRDLGTCFKGQEGDLILLV